MEQYKVQNEGYSMEIWIVDRSPSGDNFDDDEWERERCYKKIIKERNPSYL